MLCYFNAVHKCHAFRWGMVTFLEIMLGELDCEVEAKAPISILDNGW